MIVCLTIGCYSIAIKSNESNDSVYHITLYSSDHNISQTFVITDKPSIGTNRISFTIDNKIITHVGSFTIIQENVSNNE